MKRSILAFLMTIGGMSFQAKAIDGELIFMWLSTSMWISASGGFAAENVGEYTATVDMCNTVMNKSENKSFLETNKKAIQAFQVPSNTQIDSAVVDGIKKIVSEAGLAEGTLNSVQDANASVDQNKNALVGFAQVCLGQTQK